MRKKYDFSKGERGKFYHPDAEFDLPVYLEPDITEYIKAIALKKVLFRYYFDYGSQSDLTISSSRNVLTWSVRPAAIPGVLEAHLCIN